MLRRLSTLLGWGIRSLRGRREAVQETQREKVRFTQEEITEMGQYKQPGARTVVEVFKDKAERVKKKGGTKQDSNKEINGGDDKEQRLDEQFLNQSYEKRTKRYKEEKLKSFRIYKEHRQSEQKEEDIEQGSLQSQEGFLREMSRVRLQPQYLPYEYMKKVQKIFHKYDQTQLREIAQHFSNLMRLRYTEEKIDYESYPELSFNKLEAQLPSHKKVEQIYLIGKEKIFQEQPKSTRKVDDDPIENHINYTQNIVISYLLNRAPRTYAVAFRIISEIKKKYPSFKPDSFLDFGAGLSSGSTAFVQLYGDQKNVFSIEPAGKMRKLGKFLTSHTKIEHFQSLAELTSRAKQVDIVYCGYVLNELRPELTEVYLQSLWAKVKPQGFLALVEYGNPYGSRLIHQARKWALEKQLRIAAPCAHHHKCPLAKSKFWCHFDQPSGMFPREAFGKLPTDNSVKLQKYSYLILQKLQISEGVEEVTPNITHEWDRVLFPLMRKGKHFVFNLCSKAGKFEKRISAKSHGLEYRQGRKLKWGDLWRFGHRIPNRYRKERRTGKRLW